MCGIRVVAAHAHADALPNFQPKQLNSEVASVEASQSSPASRYRGSAIGLRRGAADLEFACAESDLAACIKPLFRMGIV